jgi:hypothetical protein
MDFENVNLNGEKVVKCNLNSIEFFLLENY